MSGGLANENLRVSRFGERVHRLHDHCATGNQRGYNTIRSIMRHEMVSCDTK